MNLPHQDEFTPQLLRDAADALKLYREVMGHPLTGDVLDIGAHHGTFALSALEAGAHFVLAVEASRKNYRGLVANLYACGGNADARWHAMNEAAWEGEDLVVLLRTTTGGNSGQYSVCFADRYPTSEHVESVRFTALLEEGPWDYVKIDVEGAEWSWLTGPKAARDASEHFRYLDIELHPLDNREYYPPPVGPVFQLADVDQWFRAAGCRVLWHETMPTRLAIVAP